MLEGITQLSSLFNRTMNLQQQSFVQIRLLNTFKQV